MEQKVDKLKNRRRMAMTSALYSLVVWPNLLIGYHIMWGLEEIIINHMLIYVGTLATGPIGAYIWAANRKDRVDASVAQPQTPS